jgi:hypothetical protein
MFGVPIVGYDRYTRRTGEMRWRAWNRFPVMSASGPDISRSAAGRLTSEFIFVPAVALSPAVAWKPLDDNNAVASLPCDGVPHDVTVTVADSGALQQVSISRWASVDKEPFRDHLFTAVVDGERVFGSYTIASRVVAGYGFGSEGWPECAFIHQVIDDAEFA